jgi:hypothetical protein
VSDLDRDATGDDWVPELEDADVEHFKGGWNADDGEVVWSVSGRGDGLPSHAEQLSAAWGREPNMAAGDVLGMATHVPSRSHERATVVIQGYYGASLPDDVVRWFQKALPGLGCRASAP